MSIIPTVKVKPWGEGQGDHVVINAEDFDPKVHTPFEVLGGASPLASDLDAGDVAKASPAKKPAKRRKGKR